MICYNRSLLMFVTIHLQPIILRLRIYMLLHQITLLFTVDLLWLSLN